MSWAEPRRSQVLLCGAVVAAFAISAVTDVRWLAGLAAVALGAFRRGAARHLRRLLLMVVPLSLSASIASWAWQRLAAGRPADWEALAALNLRTTLVAFVTFSVLARVSPFHALAPSPSLSRLLAIALAQIHALRLLVTESALGLRSRMARRPSARDVLRGAGTVTGTLLAISARNSRDVADALRSRGA